jgi:hypothetical protein
MNAHFCPDCGGILEAIHPPWLAAIDLASAAAERDAPPSERRCLICGYHEPAGPAHAAVRVPANTRGQ